MKRKRDKETVEGAEGRGAERRARERKRWLYNRMSEVRVRRGRITEDWARSMLPYGGWRGRVERGKRAREAEGGGRTGESGRHCKRQTREGRGDRGENRYFNWTK